MLLLVLSACGPDAAAAPRSPARGLLALTRYVDPFIGTRGDGNVFPGASMPNGMVQWSPETTAGGLVKPGGYNDGDLIIRGFGLTHLSGAGCVSFENVPFLPTIRPIKSAPLPNGSPYSDRFVRASERASPGYYGVRLASGIGVELSATTRTGIGAFTYPAVRTASMLIDVGNATAGRTNIDGADRSNVRIVNRNEVIGSASSGHFCNLANHYTLYFAARFDRPFARTGTWRNGSLSPAQSVSGHRVGAFVQFDTRRARTVMVRVGLSYVSVRNAEVNLARESKGRSFAAVRRQANAVWNERLNRIQATGGTTAQERILYTALYHSLLQPTVFSDANGEYRGFDGKVHRARGYTQYANFSGWDIYRSEIPLLAWLAPHDTAGMMQSLVADAEQGGWLPKWPVANAYTGEMDGDSADPILASASAFGAAAFDRRAALHAMIKGAISAGIGPAGYLERPQVADYLRRGWVPPVTGGWGPAAETLEYATDDFAIAQMARSLGAFATYRYFLRHSRNWRTLFNPSTGFIEPRQANGAFLSPFDPASTVGFVEGNAWQYTWMVPHDLAALIARMGGASRTAHRLDLLFGRLNAGPTAAHYWGGNEPELEVPWEYDFIARPWRTQQVVRRIADTLYRPTRAGLPGNDDLGALSSWYVWAAMGLYPEIPGIGGLALSTPLFPRITIRLSGGRQLLVTAPGAPAQAYVAALRINGHPYNSTWLPLTRLSGRTTLHYTLSATPSRRWGTCSRRQSSCFPSVP